MKEILEAIELCFMALKLCAEFLFTPPMLYFTVLIIAPSVLGGLFAVIKRFLTRR